MMLDLDLDRVARAVRHTSNAVLVTDAALHPTWVNESFTHLSGDALADAQGRTPGELLGNHKADPATIKMLLDAAAAGTACLVEVLNRAKEGRDCWGDTDVQPTRNENRVLVGFMEVATDISACKQGEGEGEGEAEAARAGNAARFDRRAGRCLRAVRP